MLDLHDDISNDNTEILKRLREEVTCIAQNLEALTYNPEEFGKVGIRRLDPAVELHLSFHHEPVESQF